MSARSTLPQSSKEKKTIFNHYVRTWRELKLKGTYTYLSRSPIKLLRWLSETLDTLTKDRSVEEQKVEGTKLTFVIERHQSLIPRIKVK